MGRKLVAATSEKDTTTTGEHPRGRARGVFDCDKNIWTRTEAEAGWFGEVWPDRDGNGWRYWVHCRHTLPNPVGPTASRTAL